MRFFHSFKTKRTNPTKTTGPSALLILSIATCITALSGLVTLLNMQLKTWSPMQPPIAKIKGKAPGFKKVLSSKNTKKNSQAPPETKNRPAGSTKPITPPATSALPVFKHLDVISTIFWVGEGATSDNAHISNAASSWDGNWAQHFGGIDDPNNRNGYLPAGFTPKENPFYIALPYSDLTEVGDRKANATNCPQYAQLKDSPYSWCKNSWLAIRSGDKIAYAQWEDSGPLGEDDINYVFGSARPVNTWGAKAGIDLSPALRDYLGVEDVDKCDWTFVDFSAVADGPWKQIITTTPGTMVN